jgi:hypothetical protein
MFTTGIARAVRPCLVALMASVPDAQAQSERLSIGAVRELVKPEGLTLPVLPPLNSALATKTSIRSETLAASLQQQLPSQGCRHGRRAWIGGADRGRCSGATRKARVQAMG